MITLTAPGGQNLIEPLRLNHEFREPGVERPFPHDMSEAIDRAVYPYADFEAFKMIDAVKFEREVFIHSVFKLFSSGLLDAIETREDWNKFYKNMRG
jgi:hypothetical protein